VKLAKWFVTLLFLAQVGLSQTPVPRGVRQGEQADAQAQQNIPPPVVQRRASLDPAKLQREANELATLAASIPSAVDQTTHGVLPNDLLEKLKKIEKLSKRLRSELNP
jgi:hypothetical protein